LFCFAALLASCEYDSHHTITYSVNEPVFMTADEFKNSVSVKNTAHILSDYGKICFYQGYLFISEPDKGIHIINNTNPAAPQIVGYIELAGNNDLAIRNDLLYADALANLVWFDLSDPAKPVLKGILENAFPEIFPPIPDNNYGIDYAACYPEGGRKGLIVGWKLTQKTQEVTEHHSWWGWEKGDAYTDVATPSANDKGGSTGINGSMSRFSLYQNYLYSVVNNQMCIFNLSDETPVKAVENLYIGSNVETIFSYKDKMFMGTPTGMLIYSVSNPLSPQYCSSMQHVFGCDPVVVDNDLAYVTVHSGNFCGQTSNELFIVDVKDVYNPRQLVSFTMTNPKGLGIDRNTLFLCDDGLKIFRIGNDPQQLAANQIIQYKGMDGYDLIPFDNTLMMIADNGLYQYDYTNLEEIRELSVIPIQK
jgi:hypothetical protein